MTPVSILLLLLLRTFWNFHFIFFFWFIHLIHIFRSNTKKMIKKETCMCVSESEWVNVCECIIFFFADDKEKIILIKNWVRSGFNLLIALIFRKFPVFVNVLFLAYDLKQVCKNFLILERILFCKRLIFEYFDLREGIKLLYSSVLIFRGWFFG